MSTTTKLIILFTIYFIAKVAMAAGGGAGDDSIPAWMIIKQAVNVLIFVSLLVYFAKNAVRSHFLERSENFTAHLRKAQAAKEAAEKKHKSIRERLTQLDDTTNHSLEAAKAEAEELKHKLIADAKTLTQKMEEEAQNSAKVEVEKAVAHLREELLENAVHLAKESLNSKFSNEEQKQLQNEFVEKIQVVQ